MKLEQLTKVELIAAANRIKRIIYPCREIVNEYIRTCDYEQKIRKYD